MSQSWDELCEEIEVYETLARWERQAARWRAVEAWLVRWRWAWTAAGHLVVLAGVVLLLAGCGPSQDDGTGDIGGGAGLSPDDCAVALLDARSAGVEPNGTPLVDRLPQCAGLSDEDKASAVRWAAQP